MSTADTLIFFTGGGSAGHVTPNIALIESLKEAGYRLAYVGGRASIEQTLIQPLAIDYYAISAGKLRRQFDWRNLWMPAQVVRGIWQSFWLCKRHKPKVIFSKGGFVALPLIIGAWLNRIPVITHESDLSPGLANRLAARFVKHIAYSFPQSEAYFKDKRKILYTGSPIRPSLLQGSADRARTACGFSDDKPVLFIYGGGLGSIAINQTIWTTLPQLLPSFQVIHACGKGKTDAHYDQIGYRQFDYLVDELPDMLALADIVVSRAGANSIIELLTLAKPHLLIPLSRQASRGDQIENAAYYQAQGLSAVLAEEALTPDSLLQAVNLLWQQREMYQHAMRAYALPDAKQRLLDLIKAQCHD